MPVADLTADASDASGVTLDTTFTLQSRTSTPAADVAARLEIDPPLVMTTVTGPDASSVVLRPAAVLAPGATYRFLLRAADGSVAGSWAFQAEQPLNVASTLPRDEATGVPLDTGIEVAFDQDGVTGAAAHVTIRPAVPGRFEQHGRTLAFVPSQKLAAGTLYTVTVRHGIGIAGSDQVLERDVVFAFETARATPAHSRPYVVQMGRPLVESPTDEAAVLPVSIYAYSSPAPATLPVQVYALPSIDAAITAVHRIATSPDWADWSSAGLVGTAGLPRVLAFTGRVETLDTDGDRVIRFPVVLDAGWYLVVIPRDGRDIQALLQVTDVAVYAMATDTRTLVWANDVATRHALAGATVVTADGTRLGTTGNDGLLIAATPAAARAADWEVLESDPPVLAVTARDGRAALVALGAEVAAMYAPEDRDVSRAAEPSEQYHLVLVTDRSQVRTSDTVNVWGVVRERSGGAVPASVEVRLVAGWMEDGPAASLVTVSATPDRQGMFTAAIPIRDLPLGPYSVELWAGGRSLAATYLEVADIRKPAFRVDVTTDHRVYVAGEQVAISASIGFFDGTRAPGVELTVQASGAGTSWDQRVTTDSDGAATVTMPARAAPATEGWDLTWISVAPTHPEEGEIWGTDEVTVFPSTWWLAASGSAAGSRLTVTGTLSELDRTAVEHQLATDRAVGDPAGPAVPHATVTATVTEVIPVRTRTGTRYDFIAKRTVPVYEYSTRDEAVGSWPLTTAADGTFRLATSVPAGSHEYRVLLSATDEGGRPVRLTVSVWTGSQPAIAPVARPSLANGYPCWASAPITITYRIGDPISLTVHDAGAPLPTGGDNRYLFTVSRQGLQAATLQASPVFSGRFTEADVPNALIEAVWFTGRGYVPAVHPVNAELDLAERTLVVTVTPDQPGYEPGDDVTVTIRTTDRAGHPVAASVVVRAIDEKLFAMGAASDVDLLREVYRSVDDGVLGTYASHEPPYPTGGYGCGDTTGGGDGESFRDWLLFRKVETGADGLASVTFRLSDDLTSWHVSASALTEGLEAGSGNVLVPVGLPFFVEAVLAPEYLANDQPVLRLRAFGSGLVAGAAVRVTVDAPTLGITGLAVDGTAFADLRVPLPALTPGTHRITMTGTSGTGASGLSYRLVRSITVVESRLTRTASVMTPLTATWQPPAGSGLTTVTVTDAARAPLIATLEALAAGTGERVDQSLAAAVAREILVTTFGRPEWSLAPATFDRSLYQDERGVALLPYASPDLVLTVRAALAAPDRLNASLLSEALSLWLAEPTATRERRTMALAGLAAMGRTVLVDARAIAAEPDLTVRERLWLGIAFAAAGDDDAARTIEQRLLAESGQRLGPWLRLRVGTSLDDTLDATSLLALLAADLGDPRAADAEAYVTANPGHDDLFVLQQLAYIRGVLERGAPAAGRFASTIDGVRETHDLGAGQPWSVTLSQAQLAGLRLEALSGDLAVTTTSTVPFDVATATPDPDVQLVRTVSPAGVLPDDGVVRVTLVVTFGTQAPAACYEVTDRLPSGLAPITRTTSPAEEERAVRVPDLVEGQRVSWCVTPDAKHRTYRLGYTARVVSPGTYRWEPATVQLAGGGARVSATPVVTVTIR